MQSVSQDILVFELLEHFPCRSDCQIYELSKSTSSNIGVFDEDDIINLGFEGDDNIRSSSRCYPK